MEYIKCKHYDEKLVKEKIMGPNPLKLSEELLSGHKIPDGSVVMDLGSGQGLTSVFFAKEYSFKTVYAADLWSEPEDNQKFFDEMKVSREKLIPVKADAENLPFEREFFDVVVSVDSYNYFGRDAEYLDKKLLPFIKSGGYIYVAIPGMTRDFHGEYPPELLLSWTPDMLDYIRDIEYWRGILSACKGAELLSISETDGNEELWNDWLSCENSYAVSDRKSMEAGGGKYMNFLKFVLRKK